MKTCPKNCSRIHVCTTLRGADNSVGRNYDNEKVILLRPFLWSSSRKWKGKGTIGHKPQFELVCSSLKDAEESKSLVFKIMSVTNKFPYYCDKKLSLFFYFMTFQNDILNSKESTTKNHILDINQVAFLCQKLFISDYQHYPTRYDFATPRIMWRKLVKIYSFPNGNQMWIDGRTLRRWRFQHSTLLYSGVKGYNSLAF